MDTKTIVWTLYEDEGYWKYSFGLKDGTMVTSPRLMTKESAIKSFHYEVNKLKRQFGEKQEVVIQKI